MPASKCLCWLLSVLIILPLKGCSTIQSVEGSNDDLPSRIRAENLISEGDRVEIRTIRNERYRFEVLGVDDEIVRGDAVSIRIDDIADLRIRRFSGQRTAGLVVAIVGLIVIAAIAFNDSANNICSDGGCAPEVGY